MKNLDKHTIEFKVTTTGKTIRSFTVENNIEELGLDLQVALESWLVRTDSFTVDSFCAYIISKDPINIICKPQK